MGKNGTLMLLFPLALALLMACGEQDIAQEQRAEPGGGLRVESTAFAETETIPVRYTCDGDDVSPPLSWSEPPAGAQSLVLIGDDPDAPMRTWDHWVLFDIPTGTRSLPEGIPPDPIVPGIGTHGSNSWRRLGYGGPCPPPGEPHRYYYTIYALDASLDLEPGSTRKDIEEAMQGHVLAEGKLMGRYGR